MAGRFYDSFDHYATAELTQKWTQIYNASGNSLAVSSSNGRRSTFSLRASVTNAQAMNPVGVVLGNISGATCVIGFAFKQVGAFSATTINTGAANMRPEQSEGSSGGQVLFMIRRLGTNHVCCVINASGQLNFRRGDGTDLGTTANALTNGSYNYIEVKTVIADGTGGSIEVYVDGVLWNTFSSLDTRNGNDATWDEIVLGKLVGKTGSGTVTWDYDDLYVLDGSGSDNITYLGDVRIDVLLPDAAGNTSGWTRSTGADQWATIDEASTNGDTDYNSASAVSTKDTLNFPAAPVTGATIRAVQVNMLARKTDAGAAAIKAVTRIGSTDYNGSVEHGLSTSYTDKREVWDVKPSDSTAWTDSDVTAAEFGYIKTA